ncbi:hypothetical protein G6K88_31270 [Agrobacterium rhizogenes]|uniref:Uncharacterized protein n=1 Tax=Rhizobium rhizogenes TaxID=359 RepID=A0A7S4ZRX9_RHIRH|nr:hypothetical protein [Rhizobium rhizogenes]NTG30121.1 hypothetical protein [Rhizobium rhizogenes]NTI06520.1 hypothetical protein [Rhizobium rhizogenes]NTI13325.1 hypothetical protein [Rhizobium rhizogenes]QCL09340.1 hypothetical protein pC5.7c_473 [Rhizobium rhizogenes]QCL09762.1 hypothetical protein pC5.8b_272 [Rhizobium rhizogenes]
MEKPAFMKHGSAGLIELAWGLDFITGQKVAAIVAFCGSLEYHLERAIWKLRSIDPQGIRPDTDGKIITAMIDMLEQSSGSQPSEAERKMLEMWCSGCRSGFTIRNNIVHGVPMKFGSTLAFCRNPQWHGEQRKKRFGDFWADENTLDMVRDAFAVLFRFIVQIEMGETPLAEIAHPFAMKALGEACSVLGEFANWDYNPSFEKY